jgi:hypothetical protein
VAIRLENTAIFQYSVMNLSAEYSNIVKSSLRHLHREAPCLNCHTFLKRDFTCLKLIRGAFFRHKLLYTPMVSVYTLSRDTIPLNSYIRAIQQQLFLHDLVTSVGDLDLFAGSGSDHTKDA